MSLSPIRREGCSMVAGIMSPVSDRCSRSQHLRSRCQFLTVSYSAAIVPALLAILAMPVAAQVNFDVGADQVAVQVNGKPFTVLHFGKDEHKPFLHPLLTPS